jgi:CelD/BcsL family acetyltransferase involved in cellulose biosynthesis
MNLKIVIKDILDPDLKLIWEKFERNSENYCFQNYYWCKHWYEIVSEKTISYIVLVYDDLNQVMLLPLCVESFFGVKCLRWMGGLQSDYMNGLYVKNLSITKKEFNILWKNILTEINKFDLIFLDKQPEFINNTKNPFVEFIQCKKISVSHYVDKEKLTSFNFSTKKKSNIKIKFLLSNNSSDYIKNLLNILTEKIKRLKNKKLRNSFNKKNIKFYLDFDTKKLENGSVHLSKLLINNAEVAGHWGIVYKKRFYYLLPSVFESDFLKYSPGKVLINELINWAKKNNIDIFDFAIGDESYKKESSNKSLDLYRYCDFKNVRGYFFFLIYFLRLTLKKS